MLVSKLVDQAVAARFRRIRNRLSARSGEYIYDGPRLRPQALGFRLRQKVLGSLQAVPPLRMVAAILVGLYDRQVENAWHDAAAAEFYYTKIKRYD